MLRQCAQQAAETAAASAAAAAESVLSEARRADAEVRQVLKVTLERLAAKEREVDDLQSQMEGLKDAARYDTAELQRLRDLPAAAESLEKLEAKQKEVDDLRVRVRGHAAELQRLRDMPVLRQPLKPRPPWMEQQKHVRERGIDDKRYWEWTAAGYLDLDSMQVDCRTGACSYKTALRIIQRRIHDPRTPYEELEELEASKEELQFLLHQRQPKEADHASGGRSSGGRSGGHAGGGGGFAGDFGSPPAATCNGSLASGRGDSVAGSVGAPPSDDAGGAPGVFGTPLAGSGGNGSSLFDLPPGGGSDPGAAVAFGGLFGPSSGSDKGSFAVASCGYGPGLFTFGASSTGNAGSSSPSIS